MSPNLLLDPSLQEIIDEHLRDLFESGPGASPPRAQTSGVWYVLLTALRRLSLSRSKYPERQQRPLRALPRSLCFDSVHARLRSERS
jgi:hypothetical protein